MATIVVEEVFTRDRSSGIVHRRFSVPGVTELLTFEADNLDRAGDYDFVPASAVMTGDRRYCRRCFPLRSEPT